MIALWNSPVEWASAIRLKTLAPPEDSPISVTLPGSPPKAAMFLALKRARSADPSTP